ncbi:MAG: hypothetical protein QG657_2226 [Acidobacteriota bacterium]|nr:hypothetical protein [Acidobacteriota bacterium]
MLLDNHCFGQRSQAKIGVQVRLFSLHEVQQLFGGII